MADEILQVEARLKDYITGNLAQLEQNIKSFSDKSTQSFKKVTEASSGLDKLWREARGFAIAQIGVNSLAAALGKLKQVVTEGIVGAAQYESAIIKTANAIGKYSNALTGQADAIQEVSTFDSTAIMNAQALLGYYVKTEDAVKKLTPAVVDFAAALGMDLNTAAMVVAKSIGSHNNMLGRYGIQVVGAVGSTQRMESALSALERRFGGTAKAMSETGMGPFTKFKNIMGDAARTVGEYLLPKLQDLADWFTKNSPYIFAAADTLGAAFKLMFKTLQFVFLEIKLLLSMLVFSFIDSFNTIVTVIDRLVKIMPKQLIPKEWRAGLDNFTEGINATTDKWKKGIGETKDAMLNVGKDILDIFAGGGKPQGRRPDIIKRPSGGGGEEDLAEKLKMVEDRIQSTKDKISELNDALGKNKSKYDQLKNSLMDLTMAKIALYADRSFEDKQKSELDALKARQDFEMNTIFETEEAKRLTISKHAIETTTMLKKQDKDRKESSIAAVGGALGALSNLFGELGKKNKAFAVASKLTAVGEATVNTFLAATKALSSVPYPYNFIAMGATIATGLAQVIKISTTPLAAGTRYATGGNALVGERGMELVAGPRVGYLPPGSTVYNNNETRNIMGGGHTVNISMNIPAGATVTASAAGKLVSGMKDMARDLQYALKNGYLNDFKNDLKMAI